MTEDRVTEQQLAIWLIAATQEGREAGERAASWATDGNTTKEHAARMVEWLDNGDPRADDYLPARPDLSGEWSDTPTPIELYREITNRNPEDSLGFETEHGWLIDKLATAWEEGVSETFEPTCERLLRAVAS